MLKRYPLKIPPNHICLDLKIMFLYMFRSQNQLQTEIPMYIVNLAIYNTHFNVLYPTILLNISGLAQGCVCLICILEVPKI